MQTRVIYKLLSAALPAVVLCAPHAAGGAAGALSNREKKEIVYQLYSEGKKDFPEVKDLSAKQAMQRLQHDRLVFVDTRKPAEMKVSMLPAAITKKAYLREPERYRDAVVVAYCTISYRSGVFARNMADKGFTVYNLKGGILAWTLEGGSVYDPQGRKTRRIHVFAERWNYAPRGYRTETFNLWEQIF